MPIRLVPLAALWLVALGTCGRTETYRASPVQRDAGQLSDGGAPADAGIPTCPFELDATVPAKIRITADDYFALFVQGTLIDDTERLWHEVQTYPIVVFRHPARANVLAVKARNQWVVNGTDRGLLFELSTPQGTLVSDTTWKMSRAAPVDFSAATFDDSHWQNAVDEGPHGMAPYGALLGTSTARRIWSYDSNLPASAKPTIEAAFFRKTFFLWADGTPHPLPGPCP